MVILQLGAVAARQYRQMRARMLLQVIASAEALAARVARVRSDAAVDALVPRQFLVARERFATLRVVAAVRPLAGVDADVPLQLAVVGEGDTAVRAHEAFGPLLASAQLLGARLFCENALVGVLHFVRAGGGSGQIVDAGVGGRVSKVRCG